MWYTLSRERLEMNTVDHVREKTFRVITREIIDLNHRRGFTERLDRVVTADKHPYLPLPAPKVQLDAIERDLIANGYFDKDEA